MDIIYVYRTGFSMGTEMGQRTCVKTTEYTVKHIIYCIVYIYFHNFMNLCRTDKTTWDLIMKVTNKMQLYRLIYYS